MNSLDLFSCLGCHALGFERAGIETVAFCELNEFRQARLAERFPGKAVYGDVRDFLGVPADIVIGGPPCQRTSVAAAVHGYRTGDSLWPHQLRIGLNVGAEWIVVEQPPGNAKWESEVASDLSRAGYHSARIEFSASDLGAPYLRRRVYILACTDLPRLEIAWRSVPSAIDCVARAADARGDWCADQLASIPVDAGSAGERGAERREWIEALGDSNPPHMAEVIGRAIMQQDRMAEPVRRDRASDDELVRQRTNAWLRPALGGKE